MKILNSLFFFLQIAAVTTPLISLACSRSENIGEVPSSERERFDLNREILKILNTTPPCDSLDDCKTINVTLTPKSHPKSSAERILVIDSGIRLAAYTRYKSRVLDHLISNEDGFYVSSPQVLKIPTVVNQVLSHLLDEKYPHTPAYDLNEISEYFTQRVKILESNVGHGNEIFATLADLNPEAEFIIADLMGSVRDGYCKLNDSHEALEKYRRELRHAASSLGAAIQKFEIDYVNMSFGHTANVFKDNWAAFCKQDIPSNSFFFELQRIYLQEFYKPLFSSNNVVFFQAAPYSVRPIKQELDPDFYIDSQNVDNRLRVSGFSEVNPMLSMLGSNNKGLLQDIFKGPWDCVDFYINFGISHKRPYSDGPYPVLTTVEGVGAFSLGTRPSTSSATPIGLSYLNFLKKSGIIEGIGSELVLNFKNHHEGKLVEPARYKQFEVYRLGRMK